MPTTIYIILMKYIFFFFFMGKIVVSNASSYLYYSNEINYYYYIYYHAHPWSSNNSCSSKHCISIFLFFSWSRISRLGCLLFIASMRSRSFSVFRLVFSLVLRTKDQFRWTKPFVPEPLAVWRPIPLYILSRDSGTSQPEETTEK